MKMYLYLFILLLLDPLSLAESHDRHPPCRVKTSGLVEDELASQDILSFYNSEKLCRQFCGHFSSVTGTKNFSCLLLGKELFTKRASLNEADSTQKKCSTSWSDNLTKATEQGCRNNCWETYEDKKSNSNLKPLKCVWGNEMIYEAPPCLSRYKESPAEITMIGAMELKEGSWNFREILVKFDGEWSSVGKNPQFIQPGKCFGELPRKYSHMVYFNGKFLGKIKTYRVSKKNGDAYHKLTSTFKPILKQKSFSKRSIFKKIGFAPIITTTAESQMEAHEWQEFFPGKDSVDIVLRSLRKTLKSKFQSMGVEKAYINKKGDQVIGVYYELYDEEGLGDFLPFLEWFYLGKNKDVVRIFPHPKIDVNSDDLIYPIDVADYDGDGVSEFVFGVSRFTHDGFDSSFEKFFMFLPGEQH